LRLLLAANESADWVSAIAHNGPAIKGVFVAEGTEAVGSIYRIDFQFL
jgi:hypothetical protein